MWYICLYVLELVMVCTDLVQDCPLAPCPWTSGLPWGHLEVRYHYYYTHIHTYVHAHRCTHTHTHTANTVVY